MDKNKNHINQCADCKTGVSRRFSETCIVCGEVLCIWCHEHNEGFCSRCLATEHAEEVNRA